MRQGLPGVTGDPAMPNPERSWRSLLRLENTGICRGGKGAKPADAAQALPSLFARPLSVPGPPPPTPARWIGAATPEVAIGGPDANKHPWI